MSALSKSVFCAKLFVFCHEFTSKLPNVLRYLCDCTSCFYFNVDQLSHSACAMNEQIIIIPSDDEASSSSVSRVTNGVPNANKSNSNDVLDLPKSG